ncbi:hypothetical protein AB0M10_01625 [Streptomyces sp. NPDC051840]|uniref:hypothetical protein n=1 Tax=unclassified Streptomyces TaxID=2593676 RepID=UPI0034484DB8
MPLSILSDPSAVVSRLRTPSASWVEACTGEAGALFPSIDIPQARFSSKGVGWVAEPAEIFTGCYDEDEEIPDECVCIASYGLDQQMMEMPTGEIAVYNPGGWDSASGMASSCDFVSEGHAGAAVSLLAAIVAELEVLDGLDSGPRETALRVALGEVDSFVEALPDDVDGPHFWSTVTLDLRRHYRMR